MSSTFSFTNLIKLFGFAQNANELTHNQVTDVSLPHYLTGNNSILKISVISENKWKIFNFIYENVCTQLCVHTADPLPADVTGFTTT